MLDRNLPQQGPDDPHGSVTISKEASNEHLLAGPNKSWAHVVARDTLPQSRLSALSSKIELVDLGLTSDPNVLEIEEIEGGATGAFVSDLNLKSPIKEKAVDYDLVIAMVVLLVSFVFAELC
ncbi:hypothetical protein U1Q18_017887 [Sarracenia purpurea var. burkii]